MHGHDGIYGFLEFRDDLEVEAYRRWLQCTDGGTISNVRELTSELHAQLLGSKPQVIREVLEALRRGVGKYKHAFVEGSYSKPLRNFLCQIPRDWQTVAPR